VELIARMSERNECPTRWKNTGRDWPFAHRALSQWW